MSSDRLESQLTRSLRFFRPAPVGLDIVRRVVTAGRPKVTRRISGPFSPLLLNDVVGETGLGLGDERGDVAAG